MSSNDRRAAARRRAWGRGPTILRFEPLEGRQLLAASYAPRADLVSAAFSAPMNLDWDDTFEATGVIANQGNVATAVETRADIYASINPGIGPASVLLGSVKVPAGLAPGAKMSYNVQLDLPPSAIPNVNESGLIYLTARVNPDGVVPEYTRTNNEGRGQGYDIAPIYIVARAPANLEGTSFGVYPEQTVWGNSILVSTQIKNTGGGAAPATRARLVLRPADAVAGSQLDVTVADVQVPALGAYQTASLQTQVTLPAIPPTTLANGSRYVLALHTDADYLTNPMAPNVPDQGAGLDSTVLTIAGGPAPGTTASPRPDLTATSVVAPGNAHWGQTIQVSTKIQNVGQVPATEPFKVQFYITGAGGGADRAVYLGAVDLPGLEANTGQDIAATLKIPGRLPSGVALNSVGLGKVVAVIDGENRVDEVFPNNNTSDSAPITLRVLGRDGNSTVPTVNPTPTPRAQTTTPARPVQTPRPANAPTVTRRAPNRPAVIALKEARAARAAARPKYIAIRPKPADNSIERQILNFPKNVGNFFEDIGRSIDKRF